MSKQENGRGYDGFWLGCDKPKFHMRDMVMYYEEEEGYKTGYIVSIVYRDGQDSFDTYPMYRVQSSHNSKDISPLKFEENLVCMDFMHHERYKQLDSYY